MDQTPLPFVMDDNKTYENVDANEFLTASVQSGFDKCQWTVQLTIFAVGITLPSLLIFSGKEFWITTEE